MSYYVVTFPTYPDPSIRFVRFTTRERAEADRYLRALRSGAELLTYDTLEERDAAWPELAPPSRATVERDAIADEYEWGLKRDAMERCREPDLEELPD